MKPVAKKATPAAIAVLRQATALRPKRKKASDGLLPYAAHLKASPDSDHNTGFAVDLTHDPAFGIDCREVFEKLKDDKRVYSNETFLRLLQIVGRENTIIMNIDTVLPNSLITLGETLEKIDHENDEIVEPALRKLMLDLLHKFSVSESDVSKETEKLVNY